MLPVSLWAADNVVVTLLGAQADFLDKRLGLVLINAVLLVIIYPAFLRLHVRKIPLD